MICLRTVKKPARPVWRRVCRPRRTQFQNLKGRLKTPKAAPADTPSGHKRGDGVSESTASAKPKRLWDGFRRPLKRQRTRA
ncbi:hypothetical protein HMPREF9120_02254 [Neisseria sp. oral taxon 020 str. F0370]|nr:hypothetical protein HMPREF9120_02254 [Neisseria sp. oral taxon 020 str. F0370]